MNVRGVRLALHPSPDYVSDVIRSTGDFYEAAILDDLAGRLTGGVIVDAGAMIGNHTAYLAAFARHSHIHAFEPEPSNYRLLERNVLPYPTVTTYQLALSDRIGPVQMVRDAANLGHSHVVPSGAFTVQAVTIDSLDLQDVALLKVDIEGHEPQALAGARATIDRWRPLILIEDWQNAYGALLPGYRVIAEWERQHQTFLYGAKGY